MFLFLPFLSFFLFAVFLKRRVAGLLWRESFLVSFLIFGLLVLLSTEVLSLFKGFSLIPLCMFWGLSVLVALILNITAREHAGWLNLPDVRSFSFTEKFLLCFIAVQAGLLFFIAVTVPPTTWDAMTYHMGRVAHWIQNSTVEFYPTNIQRQLFIVPFPEYWIAQFQILLKGDDFMANAIQYFSMIGSLLGISLIAKEAGIARLGQILTVFLAITLPNAIVEATSTQTDFVATLWSFIGVYFILKSIKYGKTRNALAAAVAVFLSFYTKGSTLFILLPFIVWLVVDAVTVKMKQPAGRWKVWGHIGLILLVAVVANAVPLMKNQHYLGSPVYPDEKGHVIDVRDLRAVISNHLLHWGMHLRLGVNPVDDAVTAAAVEKMHNWMGLTTTNSPANFPGYGLNYVDFPFYEDETPNLIFSIYFLLYAGHFLMFRRKEWGTFKGTFFLMTFLCLFIFNTLVKWSPFDGRYHLPLFMLLAPFLADVFAVRKKGLAVLIVVFIVLTIPFTFFNSSKPFVGGNLELFYKKEPKFGGPSILKTEWKNKYFYNRPGLAMPFLFTMNGISSSGCRDLGLKIGEDMWEYLFWAYFHESRTPFRIEHVLVENASKELEYPLGPFVPCAIVAEKKDEYLIHSGKFYLRVLNTAEFNLFMRADKITSFSVE